MKTITEIEAERIRAQERLDALKTSKERNALGQFATPPALALDIARYIRRRRPSAAPFRFLEPALGTGAFYSALRQAFPPEAIEVACGVELDREVATAAQRLWKNTGLKVMTADFVTRQPTGTERFDLVLTNPPYVRHHHLSRDDKARLQLTVRQELGIEVNGLAGLYCYFLLLSHRWMADGGIAAWLIPTEFMDVNYGTAVKHYLTERVRLLHIHRFQATDVQFSDALVTSAVVVFEKAQPSAQHRVRFSVGGSLSEPAKIEEVALADLRETPKWTAYPGHRSAKRTPADAITLGDLFAIKRGLATGANSFFVLAREEARKRRLPERFLRPILPSPRYLTTTVIERGADGHPTNVPQFVLLDCPLPEDQVRREFPALWEYLAEGKAGGIDRTYLASRRSPWYSQENRPAPPYLCTYMGRNGRSTKPFRFIWNQSEATAANVYLLLYPKESVENALRGRPELHEIVFSILQGIDTAALVGEGRVYGGGLHKLEPMELGRVSGDAIVDAIGKLDTDRQGELGLDTSRRDRVRELPGPWHVKPDGPRGKWQVRGTDPARKARMRVRATR